MPTVYWTNRAQTRLFIRGAELEVAKLKSGIFEMVDSLRKELDHDLLFDTRDIPDGSTPGIKIQDKPHENTVSNYNFLSDERNPFRKYRTIAVERIAVSVELQGAHLIPFSCAVCLNAKTEHKALLGIAMSAHLEHPCATCLP